MRNSKKRFVAVAVVTALLLGVAGGAYAYWTITGSGTATADTGPGDQPITINQTSVLTDLAPGVLPQTLSGNFDNPNPGSVHVATVTVSIDTVTGGDGPNCFPSDYAIANGTMTVNADVPAGNGKGSWTGATIEFVNKATPQDDCKNATVNLVYTSN